MGAARLKSPRSLNKTILYYQMAIRDFLIIQLAPPPEIVSSGELPLEEALPWLISLHQRAIKRVGKDTDPVLARSIRKLGSAVVNQALLDVLAATYSISADDLAEAQALNAAGSAISEEGQPRIDNDYDFVLLHGECEEVLRTECGVDMLATAPAFAQCVDPRLPRQLSLVGVFDQGVAWASILRPHYSQLHLFEAIRVLPKDPSLSIVLELGPWRRRELSPDVRSWTVPIANQFDAAAKEAPWEALRSLIWEQAATSQR
jgi:hypothetical protein